ASARACAGRGDLLAGGAAGREAESCEIPQQAHPGQDRLLVSAPDHAGLPPFSAVVIGELHSVIRITSWSPAAPLAENCTALGPERRIELTSTVRTSPGARLATL